MKTNQAGIDLIKSFESCRLDSYLCPAGVWTIGWGTTKGVRRGMRITQDEADRLFAEDLKIYENGVAGLVNDDDSLTANQFSALVSFAYNCGLNALRTSTLLRKVNAKDFAGAANEFSKWVRGGGKVLPGLVRRRNAEKELFLRS